MHDSHSTISFCPHCGFTLGAFMPGMRCPECGELLGP